MAALPPLLLLAFDEGFVLKELRSLKLFNMPSAQMTTLCISFDAVVAVMKAQEALAKADMLSTTYSGTQAMTNLVITVGAFLTYVLSFDVMMVCEVARTFIRLQFWGKILPVSGKVVSERAQVSRCNECDSGHMCKQPQRELPSQCFVDLSPTDLNRTLLFIIHQVQGA